MTPKLNLQKYVDEAVAWIKNYAEKAGVKGFVLGVSGGVDSAVVSALCAKTGMPVLCLEMPIHQDPSHTARSTRHIAWLKEQFPLVQSVNIDLTSAFEEMRSTLEASTLQNPDYVFSDRQKLAEANIRSRLRMITSYFYANTAGLLVAGTGNKVEDFGAGYFTIAGDGSVDFSIIGDITKTEVWAVAAHLGINQEIIDAKPTDGLWAGSPSDEDQIGASYPELEWAMEFIQTVEEREGKPLTDEFPDSVADAKAMVANDAIIFRHIGDADRKQEVMRIYLSRHRANHHKMVPIPIFSTEECREQVYSSAAQ